MTKEEFSLQVADVFQAEWNRARRKNLAIAFAVGVIVGFLFGYHTELSQIWMDSKIMTNQSFINQSPSSL